MNRRARHCAISPSYYVGGCRRVLIRAGVAVTPILHRVYRHPIGIREGILDCGALLISLKRGMHARHRGIAAE